MGEYLFEESDPITRRSMMAEFEAEWAGGNPYLSSLLSEYGRAAFPGLMREALANGDEMTLAGSLWVPSFWLPAFPRKTRGGSVSMVKISPDAAAARLARTEFNTWYVRGLSARLLAEGEEMCEVYRAAPAEEPRPECLEHEGRVYPIVEVFEGHRVRYWPPPGNPTAFSIPTGPNCHHTIRRAQAGAKVAGLREQ
jgi:hypothetical protein